jgi:hypothetical protein
MFLLQGKYVLSQAMDSPSRSAVESMRRKLAFVTNVLYGANRSLLGGSYRCRTCRKRKIRCSGEQPVCKTCLDYKHVCLGYSEPSTHVRTHSENASQTSSLTPLPSARERTNSRTVKSQSPDGASQYKQSAGGGRDQNVDHTSSQDALVSRETPSSNIRESEQHTTGASPESSRTSLSSSHRTHVPYFRYFGPTAIVPGFKQMVVQVRGSRKSNTSLSSGMRPIHFVLMTSCGCCFCLLLTVRAISQSPFRLFEVQNLQTWASVI